MDRRNLCAIVACLLLVWPEMQGHSANTANRQDSSPLRDAAERYAVYSALLTPPPLSHPDQNVIYAIVDTTIPVRDGTTALKAVCGEIPSIRPASWPQLQRDFDQNNNRPVLLKRSFSLTKPYVLLSAQQATELEQRQMIPVIQTDPPSLAITSPVEGTVDLFRLSNVFFDGSHSIAMVYVSAWCGTLCDLRGWHILEKTPTQRWREILNANCLASIS